MLIDLLREEEPSIEFLPENLLVRGRNKLVWYTAPQVLEIPFRGEIIKAPIPGLIYLAGGVLRCYAYKGKSRPTPETELHFARWAAPITTAHSAQVTSICREKS